MLNTKFSTQSQVRKYNVSNAVASARIEGIALTKQLEQNLDDYVSGKKALLNYKKRLNNAMSRYDAGDTYCYPVSPGEMLEEEFLKPLGLTKYRLAKDIGVPPQRIGDIVAGKRAITADTDLRLCKYFGLSDGWWLRGQANYDTAIARESLKKVLKKITPCELIAA